MNFIYVTKHKRTSDSTTEVAVTYIKASGKDCAREFRFSFSEQIITKLFRNVQYLIVAYDTDNPSRIWFKESDANIGYKIVKKQGARQVLSPYGLARVVDDPQSFIGDYQLMYDNTIKMWYIDRNERTN